MTWNKKPTSVVLLTIYRHQKHDFKGTKCVCELRIKLEAWKYYQDVKLKCLNNRINTDVSWKRQVGIKIKKNIKGTDNQECQTWKRHGSGNRIFNSEKIWEKITNIYTFPKKHSFHDKLEEESTRVVIFRNFNIKESNETRTQVGGWFPSNWLKFKHFLQGTSSSVWA